MQPNVGRRLKVWFENDEAWFTGTLKSYSSRRGWQIAYDPVEGEDDLISWHHLANERHEMISEGEARKPAPAPKRPNLKRPSEGESSKRAGKRKAPADVVVIKDEEDEDEDVEEVPVPPPPARHVEEEVVEDVVEEVAAPPKKKSTGAASSSTAKKRSTGAASNSTAAVDEEDEDDEVVFQGRTGDAALVDFPHARENCAQCPWRPGAESQHCENCFCFVCDVPVAQCVEWPSHCKATHTDPKWREKREQKRGGASSSSGATSSSSAPGGGGGFTPPWARPTVERWSCDEILGRVQQVSRRPSPRPFPSAHSG